ncbi:YdeI/OmpD-associated family protein [Thalassotalea marina]|uniref:DUF1905 domain-containing protein n=1 Tax=Thalassotalea marina TaxID=1673741 RepID=A0A919BI06_9GAMM|nr:YdeI/OmpD-associated family protein [Thalassotalea marina]GHF92418.1 hypothetical protein GCM10017161_20670 [Thalassotalea marina]
MASNKVVQFEAKVLKPKQSSEGDSWGFVVLPIEISNVFPRRGRTSANVLVNKHQFQQLLEPDGNKSHWLKLTEYNLNAASIHYGEQVTLTLSPVLVEPEPELSPNLKAALDSAPKALATWELTSNTAKIDWLHWISSAKQETTQIKRINQAVDMLSEGKKRVCCFDSSGFYSKSFSAPIAAD